MAEDTNKEKKDIKIPFKRYIATAVIMIITIFAFYFFNFKQYGLSPNQGDWGTFGDFMGGTLNPLLAFLSLIALLTTIRIQSQALQVSSEELVNSRKELELTRDELSKTADAQQEQSKSIKQQNFENTFFNMLDLYKDAVDNITIEKGAQYWVVDNMNNNIHAGEVLHKDSKTFSKGIINKYIKFIENRLKADLATTRISIYKKFDDHFNMHLGHYFGYIYQVLKFLSRNKQFNEDNFYSDMFRSLFSKSELKLLFYHCTTDIAKVKFRDFIKEFGFFEHLEYEKIIYSIKPFPYNDKKYFGTNKKWLDHVDSLE